MGCGGRDGSFWFFGVGLPLGMSRSLLMPQAGTESARANASASRRIMLMPAMCAARPWFVNLAVARYFLRAHDQQDLYLRDCCCPPGAERLWPAACEHSGRQYRRA